MIKKFLLIAVAATVFLAPRTAHGQAVAFFVAPSGTETGDGSLALPWDLQTALNHPAIVKPGDTIWVRGGVYRGRFLSLLRGTALLPIIVRNYPNERATIDGNPGGRYDVITMLVRGAFTWYWGLEVMSSDTMRRSGMTGSWPTDLRRGTGFEVHGPGTKFINNVVHNKLNGISIWNGADGSEAYGNLIFHNGWNASDRSHGHGIYTQNKSGMPRRMIDNVIFSNFAYGIHSYGSDAAYLDNMHVEGNTVFNSGTPSGTYFAPNILIGGGKIAQNPFVSLNTTYYQQGLMRGGQSQFGYSAGCTNLLMTDNYFAHFGNYPIVLEKCTGTIQRNHLLGFVSAEFRAAYPANTWGDKLPKDTRVFVRRNKYEAGRGNITVYNWASQPTVAVDLSQIVAVGGVFRIQDAQNFYGAPVLAGTYAGGMVALPMVAGTAVAPIGVGGAVTPHTGPLFGSFVVLANAGNPTPDPTPDPTPQAPPSPPSPLRTPPPPPPPSVPSEKPVVTIAVGDADASEMGLNRGTMVITRTGNVSELLTVTFKITGTASEYGDYQTVGSVARILAGQHSVVIAVIPKSDTRDDPNETVIVTLMARPLYDLGAQKAATLMIR